MAARKQVTYVLAAILAAVLVGFIGLILAGNLIKRLDDRRYAWAIVGADGARIGEARFDDMRPFRNGLAAVRVGELWGYADPSGAIVIAPAFADAREFDAPDRAAAREVKGDWGFIDRGGAWAIPPTLAEAWGFFEGVAAARVQIGLRTSRISTANAELSAGYLREDGSWVREPAGDREAPDRLLRVRRASEGLVAADVQGQWGFLDLAGAVRIPPAYDEVFEFSEGLAPVSRGRRWSFVDPSGATVIAGPFQDALSFREGLAAVQRADGWCYVDRSGTVAIAGPYQEARSFSEGFAAVRSGGAWGFVDREGAWAVSPAFRSVESDVSEGVAVVTRQVATLEYGHVPMDGGPIRWYVGALPFSGGVAGVRIDRN